LSTAPQRASENSKDNTEEEEVSPNEERLRATQASKKKLNKPLGLIQQKWESPDSTRLGRVAKTKGERGEPECS